MHSPSKQTETMKTETRGSLMSAAPSAATPEETPLALSSIEDALEQLRLGRPVLVADDENRENEADIVMSGATMTREWMAWAIRHSSGVICAPMPDAIADRLLLPPMVSRNEDPKGTAYTISVDAKDGVDTSTTEAIIEVLRRTP